MVAVTTSIHAPCRMAFRCCLHNECSVQCCSRSSREPSKLACMPRLDSFPGRTSKRWSTSVRDVPNTHFPVKISPTLWFLSPITVYGRLHKLLRIRITNVSLELTSAALELQRAQVQLLLDIGEAHSRRGATNHLVSHVPPRSA